MIHPRRFGPVMDDSDDSKILPFAAEAGCRPRPDGNQAEADRPGRRLCRRRRPAAGPHAAAHPKARRIGLHPLQPIAPCVWWHSRPKASSSNIPASSPSPAAWPRTSSPWRHRLAEYKVTWLREMETAQAAGLVTVVTSIEIVRAYPSREMAEAPPKPTSTPVTP